MYSLSTTRCSQWLPAVPGAPPSSSSSPGSPAHPKCARAAARAWERAAVRLARGRSRSDVEAAGRRAGLGRHRRGGEIAHAPSSLEVRDHWIAPAVPILQRGARSALVVRSECHECLRAAFNDVKPRTPRILEHSARVSALSEPGRGSTASRYSLKWGAETPRTCVICAERRAFRSARRHAAPSRRDMCALLVREDHDVIVHLPALRLDRDGQGSGAYVHVALRAGGFRGETHAAVCTAGRWSRTDHHRAVVLVALARLRIRQRARGGARPRVEGGDVHEQVCARLRPRELTARVEAQGRFGTAPRERARGRTMPAPPACWVAIQSPAWPRAKVIAGPTCSAGTCGVGPQRGAPTASVRHAPACGPLSHVSLHPRATKSDPCTGTTERKRDSSAAAFSRSPCASAGARLCCGEICPQVRVCLCMARTPSTLAGTCTYSNCSWFASPFASSRMSNLSRIAAVSPSRRPACAPAGPDIAP